MKLLQKLTIEPNEERVSSITSLRMVWGDNENKLSDDNTKTGETTGTHVHVHSTTMNEWTAVYLNHKNQHYYSLQNTLIIYHYL